MVAKVEFVRSRCASAPHTGNTEPVSNKAINKNVERRKDMIVPTEIFKIEY